MDLYGWLVLAHVVSVIVTFTFHGASAVAMFRVRAERDRARLAALLELSGGSIMLASIFLLVAIVTGVVAAITGDHFSKTWPWASIVTLVVVIGAMTPLGGIPMNKVRIALGMRISMDKKDAPAREPGTDADLETAIGGLRPELLAAIGFGGIALLSWLMAAKPF